MITRLAVDTNAVIGWLREGASASYPRGANTFIVPLPVLGELYFGAYASSRRDEHLSAVAEIVAELSVLHPDEETARLYGELRARHRLDNIRTSKMNDVWIAALCLQHDLPLLTNDRGFDSFPRLRVLHW